MPELGAYASGYVTYVFTDIEDWEGRELTVLWLVSSSSLQPCRGKSCESIVRKPFIAVVGALGGAVWQFVLPAVHEL
jgi:hypothetical protein